ncbi:ATP-binding protein [Bifidobacterium simiarum]|uniref:ATP-binding protein n=1 Tax=Bifidobacterium simiarum TaxID=2045441 RepID=UPI001BDD1C6C|nr:ATP-binding protein [Bifidobacterium simiarum]MBT1167266.1 ATP-binding protein [Bifidobacterium simiarum]
MAFIGRERELAALRRLADRDEFQMAVVYGRRRIGKTALIARFCEDRRTLWFTAREQNATVNLREFSQRIYAFFEEPPLPGGFPDWMSAFDHIADMADRQRDRPFTFVFDEFPYAAEAEPGLPSILQIAIDHRLSRTPVTMILCGSNEGFMEGRVLGYKSPLYGRRNAQIRLGPFDIIDASRLMPADAGWLDRVRYYAALGGTPYYLRQIDGSESFETNMEQLCYDMSGILYEEPMMLLREELHEPATYNSILEAIASGRTRAKEIAERVGMTSTSVSPYLSTLESLGLAERTVPFGEDPRHSRRGLWGIKDPFFAYWYRFVSPRTGLIDMGAGHAPAVRGTTSEVFDTYVGQRFETMCLQWLFRQCREGKIDLLPDAYGKWWGNDPSRREQTDIDIVMADTTNRRILLGECKWRERLNETEAIDRLRERSPLIREKGERTYWLFTKRPASTATRARAAADPALHLADAGTMFA